MPPGHLHPLCTLASALTLVLPGCHAFKAFALTLHFAHTLMLPGHYPSRTSRFTSSALKLSYDYCLQALNL
eukprot:1158743-Pelagomonas_calceolata.AAC.17